MLHGSRDASYGSGAKPYTAGCEDYTPGVDQITNRATGVRSSTGMTVAAIDRNPRTSTRRKQPLFESDQRRCCVVVDLSSQHFERIELADGEPTLMRNAH